MKITRDMKAFELSVESDNDLAFTCKECGSSFVEEEAPHSCCREGMKDYNTWLALQVYLI